MLAAHYKTRVIHMNFKRLGATYRAGLRLGLFFWLTFFVALPSWTADAPIGVEVIAQAYAERRSEVLVEAQGVVSKILKDDNHGHRHQRFIVKLANGQTVLIAHNIDLSPRLEGLIVGDMVQFKGEYIWNSHGGLVHWTHPDPSGKHPGGWLRKSR